MRFEKGNVRKSLPLNGEWEFCLDPKDEISIEHVTFKNGHKIQVPGSWEEQGYGEESEHDPLGTWKKEREYIGKAWYWIEVDSSKLVSDQHHYLVLSGVHWFTEVWLDGMFVGNGEGLVTDQRFDLTSFIKYDKVQTLVISVDNRLHIPLMESHIHSYHTATNWGGITGGVEIESLPVTKLERVSFYPEKDAQSWRLRAEVCCEDIRDCQLSVVIRKNGSEKVMKEIETSIQLQQSHSLIEVELDLNEADITLWSDSHPALYDVECFLHQGGLVIDCVEKRIGVRQFQTEGHHFLLNNQPVFLSGYVDCCVFPLTGYPVWDKAHYVKQFQIAKEHGFNHVRLHGWSAPKPFWEAADEEGMLVQTELPHWSYHYINRDVQPPEEVQSFFKRELGRLLELLNEHPSFVMLSFGNELISASGHDALNELVELAQSIDPSRMYTDNTGFGQLPAHDRQGNFYIQSLNWHPPYELSYAGSPNTTEDYRELTRLTEKPVIGHEHGQFTMYIDPSIEEKFNGHLKPVWLHSFNQSVAAKGWGKRVDQFKKVTGAHMVRSYKEIMERARRTPKLAGIQLLDIRDFPGQGHATTGVLDVFWDRKGVIEPKEFKRFNDARVLLMRSDRRTFYGGEELEVALELSNFGARVGEGVLTWTINDGETVLKQGKQTASSLEAGMLHSFGNIRMKMIEDRPVQYSLSVTFECAGTKVENEWDFWSYPRKPLPISIEQIWTNMKELNSFLYGATYGELIGIEERSYKKEDARLAITEYMSRDVLQFLLDGGSVWLMAKPGNQYDEVQTKYLPVFWNFLWFPTQASTTMGMIVNEHPVFNHFPHDGMSNWQWYHLVDQTAALCLDGVPQVEPIVEVVDNFHRMKRLTYAFEAKVGKGRLFVSSFRTYETNDLKRPENSYLFQTILDYTLSESFQPNAKLTVGDLVRMFKVNGQTVT
ncbi:glycoside hydrolase family 2 protein [Halalkalibacter sp. AB-rgal2]|uniref:glycoside hydrolase family 2 protein n=1 Tax=Halalkalibacter sp. AB-rgal2 TaxID=3242695 RepID=UPI00359CBDD5